MEGFIQRISRSDNPLQNRINLQPEHQPWCFFAGLLILHGFAILSFDLVFSTPPESLICLRGRSSSLDRTIKCGKRDSTNRRTYGLASPLSTTRAALVSPDCTRSP